MLAHKLRPSLLLMDIQLAGAMDGIEAAVAIRRECDLPVVFLTAHSDRPTLDRAEIAEALGYVLKPFGDRELQTQIEMALHKHAADRRLRESEERLRALGNNIPGGAIYQHVRQTDGRLRCGYVSAGIEKIFGISAE